MPPTPMSVSVSACICQYVSATVSARRTRSVIYRLVSARVSLTPTVVSVMSVSVGSTDIPTVGRASVMVELMTATAQDDVCLAATSPADTTVKGTLPLLTVNNNNNK